MQQHDNRSRDIIAAALRAERLARKRAIVPVLDYDALPETERLRWTEIAEETLCKMREFEKASRDTMWDFTQREIGHPRHRPVHYEVRTDLNLSDKGNWYREKGKAVLCKTTACLSSSKADLRIALAVSNGRFVLSLRSGKIFGQHGGFVPATPRARLVELNTDRLAVLLCAQSLLSEQPDVQRKTPAWILPGKRSHNPQKNSSI